MRALRGGVSNHAGEQESCEDMKSIRAKESRRRRVLIYSRNYKGYDGRGWYRLLVGTTKDMLVEDTVCRWCPSTRSGIKNVKIMNAGLSFVRRIRNIDKDCLWVGQWLGNVMLPWAALSSLLFILVQCELRHFAGLFQSDGEWAMIYCFYRQFVDLNR